MSNSLIHDNMFRSFCENWSNFADMFTESLKQAGFEYVGGEMIEIYKFKKYTAIISDTYGYFEIFETFNQKKSYRLLSDTLLEDEKHILASIVDLLISINRENNIN
jgi:hypothetical protein